MKKLTRKSCTHLLILWVLMLTIGNSLTLAQTKTKNPLGNAGKKSIIDFNDLKTATDPRPNSVTAYGYISRTASLNDRMIAAETEQTKERNQLRRAFESENSYSSDRSSNNSSSSANKKTTSSQKVFRCKVYCKSSGGLITWYELAANNRSEAARWVGDNADAICNNAGNSYASRHSFPENQFYEK